jgi:hypothetical protein
MRYTQILLAFGRGRNGIGIVRLSLHFVETPASTPVRGSAQLNPSQASYLYLSLFLSTPEV